MRLPISRLRERLVNDQSDAGNAIVEFIFVAVLIMVPMVYLVVAVAKVQRSSLAVTEAAREAGRAFATGASTQDGRVRALAAARLAEQDAGLATMPDVRYVAAGTSCNSTQITPQLAAGSVFVICVRNSVTLPGVPTVLSGRAITTVGEYAVHIDDFRATS